MYLLLFSHVAVLEPFLQPIRYAGERSFNIKRRTLGLAFPNFVLLFLLDVIQLLLMSLLFEKHQGSIVVKITLDLVLVELLVEYEGMAETLLTLQVTDKERVESRRLLLLL